VCGKVVTDSAAMAAVCSQNLDDCLSKLQAIVDAAVEAVAPKEIDPETVKRVKAA
jgi:hypothetical protein